MQSVGPCMPSRCVPSVPRTPSRALALLPPWWGWVFQVTGQELTQGWTQWDVQSQALQGHHKAAGASACPPHAQRAQEPLGSTSRVCRSVWKWTGALGSMGTEKTGSYQRPRNVPTNSWKVKPTSHCLLSQGCSCQLIRWGNGPSTVDQVDSGPGLPPATAPVGTARPAQLP